LFGAPGAGSRAFLRRLDTVLLVTEEGAEMTGWAYGYQLAHPDGETTMPLYSLDVAETARGRGLGRALVDAFVAEARRERSTEVWVLTDPGNTAAIATYSAAGGRRDQGAQVMFNWHLAPRHHSSTPSQSEPQPS
jgi:ribosomal protein S18 acetylase RimI-like enzyme